MIEIIEVNTRKNFIDFIKFPFQLYRKSNYWVPPIIKDEINSLDISKNKSLENAYIKYFLAYENNQIVGRIAYMINWYEVKQLKISKLRFGHCDFVEDIKVLKALIDKSKEIMEAFDLTHIEGPMGISNMDKSGFLTEGFEILGNMTTIYNYAYYSKFFKEFGFSKNQKWIEYKVKVPTDFKNFTRISELIKQKHKLRVLEKIEKKNVDMLSKELFVLMNDSFKKLSSFIKMEDHQVRYYREKYKKILNLDFCKFIYNEENKLVAFSITIPSLARSLRKTNGKLSLLGMFHIYKALKKNTFADLCLIGIDPMYWKKGLHAIIFSETLIAFKKYEIKEVDVGPGLETNKNILMLWKKFDYKIVRKRATFLKKKQNN